MKQDRQTTIRLSDETLSALQALADEDSRPLAQYLRLVLEAHVKRTRAKAQRKES
jgi:predicted DNA-binding protein